MTFWFLILAVCAVVGFAFCVVWLIEDSRSPEIGDRLDPYGRPE